MLEQRSSTSRHVHWADASKGVGIMLMYYGHVLAALPDIESGHAHGAGLEEMRFIYAFHMPVFFLMAGFFYKPVADLGARMRMLVRRRLGPVVLFSLLLLPLWVMGPLRHGVPVWPELQPALEGYLRGKPGLNWVTWFLVCLFTCECLAPLLLPRLKNRLAQWLGGLACIWIGVIACNHTSETAHLLGVQAHTWFIYEAVVALGFYIVGHALYPTLQALSARRSHALLFSVIGFAIAAISYRLNTQISQLPVMMSAGRHGDPLAFVVSALGGSLGVMAFGMWTQRVAPLRFLGERSLVLLGLSGLFFHFVNPRLLAAHTPNESALPLTLYALLVAGASLAIATVLGELLLRHARSVLDPQGRSRNEVGGARTS